MVHTTRIKRPILERNGPSRTWTGAFNAQPRGSAQTGVARARAGDDDSGTPAYEAINDAYRVIDEYLRQGQQFAQRAWMPLGEVPSLMPGGSRTLERMMRATSDLATAWIGFLQGLSASPPGATSDVPAWPGAFATGTRYDGTASANPAPPRSDSGLGVSVVVESSRPVAVHVDLQRDAEPGTLSLGALRSSDTDVAPLSDVALESAAAAPWLTVRIRIQSSQPSGVYNGLLLDRDGRARGTLSVRLS